MNELIPASNEPIERVRDRSGQVWEVSQAVDKTTIVRRVGEGNWIEPRMTGRRAFRMFIALCDKFNPDARTGALNA